MDIAYTLLISPLETALQWVLVGSFQLTQSPGAAILLLSLVFNLLLLPVYHFTEKVQDRERAIQQRLAPKIAEFRFAFQGQVRYMMLRTLYRQNGYHPIFALRGLLPLLIQVPFFIATFHLIAHFKPLYGEPFLIFHDLGRPDGLIWGVNLMPLVMTIANLLSGFIYSRQLGKQDRIQIVGVALVFLVLLYNRPVGLVMYWTCSNVFSLFKNMAYQRISYRQNVNLECSQS